MKTNLHDPPPCKNCLTLGICKAKSIQIYRRLNVLEMSYCSVGVINKLRYECSLFQDYIYKEKTSFVIDLDKAALIIELMIGEDQ